MATATVFVRSGVAGGDPSTYVLAHLPAAFGPTQPGIEGGTIGSASRVELTVYSRTEADPPPGVASADIEITETPPTGATWDARVDVQVVWTPLKPAAAMVPVCDHAAIVSLTELVPQNPGLPAPRRFVVTDPTTVDQLRIAADGLQTPPDGIGPDLEDAGTRWIVAFAPSPASPANITFTVDVNGIAVSSPDQPHPTRLVNDKAFQAAYGHILGLPSNWTSSPDITNPSRQNA